MEQDSEKERLRSPNYPNFGLREAIERARTLYERDRKAGVPVIGALKAWGYNSMNGRSMRVVAAMRQFGLLEDAPGKLVKLTPLALDILLAPAGSAQRNAALRTAALSPSIFRKMYEEYGGEFPSDESMLHALVVNGKFNEDAARGLIASLRDTFSIPEVSGADIPVGGVAPPSDSRVSSVGPVQYQGGQANAARRPDSPPPAPVQEENTMQFTWPLSGDVVATLTVSRQIDADDIDTLAAYFDIAKKALAKAARTRAQAAAVEAAKGGAQDDSEEEF